MDDRLTEYDPVRKIYRLKVDCNMGENIQKLGRLEDLEEAWVKIKEEIQEWKFDITIKEKGWDESEGVYCAEEKAEVIRIDTLFEIISDNIGR